jgi:hypothetical protein
LKAVGAEAEVGAVRHRLTAMALLREHLVVPFRRAAAQRLLD